MRRTCGVITWIAMLGSTLLWNGCDEQNRPHTPIAPSTNTGLHHLNRAQPRLRTMKLFLGPYEITAEIARTRTEIATGMMFRQNIEETEGMLFVFEWPHRASFYMKNTTIPLSAAYIDSLGNILEIHSLKPLDETPVEASSDEVQFVLEMKHGWFQRHQIGAGAYIRTERGSLSETFLTRP